MISFHADQKIEQKIIGIIITAISACRFQQSLKQIEKHVEEIVVFGLLRKDVVSDDVFSY